MPKNTEIRDVFGVLCACECTLYTVHVSKLNLYKSLNLKWLLRICWHRNSSETWKKKQIMHSRNSTCCPEGSGGGTEIQRFAFKFSNHPSDYIRSEGWRYKFNSGAPPHFLSSDLHWNNWQQNIHVFKYHTTCTTHQTMRFTEIYVLILMASEIMKITQHAWQCSIQSETGCHQRHAQSCQQMHHYCCCAGAHLWISAENTTNRIFYSHWYTNIYTNFYIYIHQDECEGVKSHNMAHSDGGTLNMRKQNDADNFCIQQKKNTKKQKK